jgi:hypothetical protein
LTIISVFPGRSEIDGQQDIRDHTYGNADWCEQAAPHMALLTDINARDTRASMEISMTVVPPLPNRRRKANSGPSTALADAPDNDSGLRHTGIRFMGDMPWGTHICLFDEPPPQDLV